MDINSKIHEHSDMVYRIAYSMTKRNCDADVNVDGNVDETDARLIQEFVVQMHEGTLPYKPIK